MLFSLVNLEHSQCSPVYMLCCVFNCFLLLLLLHMLLTFQSDWKCLSMKTASSTLHIPQPLQLMLNSEIYHFEHCIWGNHTYFIYPFLIIYLFYFNIIIIWKNRTLNTLWIYLMNDFNKDLQSTIWEHYMSPCKMGFFFLLSWCVVEIWGRILGSTPPYQIPLLHFFFFGHETVL